MKKFYKLLIFSIFLGGFVLSSFAGADIGAFIGTPSLLT